MVPKDKDNDNDNQDYLCDGEEEEGDIDAGPLWQAAIQSAKAGMWSNISKASDDHSHLVSLMEYLWYLKTKHCFQLFMVLCDVKLP